MSGYSSHGESTPRVARRKWWGQIGRLYALALVVTLVPTLLNAGPLVRFLRYQMTGEVKATLSVARDALLHDRLDEAITAAKRLEIMDPGAAEGQALMSNALFERFWKSRDAADSILGSAIADSVSTTKSPSSVVLTATANWQYLRRNPGEAIRLLEEAVLLDETDAYAHHQLGFYLNEAGRHQDAIVHFVLALNLIPDMAWVRNNLTASLTRVGCASGRVVPPRSLVGECFNRLGVERYAKGEYRNALVYFEQAIEELPTVGVSYLNAAKSHFALGQMRAARQRAAEASLRGHKDEGFDVLLNGR